MKRLDDCAPGRREPVAMLNYWVGHARPGAVMLAAEGLEQTHTVGRALADRVMELDRAGLIIAVWVDKGDARTGRMWEWRVTRRSRDLPPSWPLLRAPATVQAVLGHAGVRDRAARRVMA